MDLTIKLTKVIHKIDLKPTIHIIKTAHHLTAQPILTFTISLVVKTALPHHPTNHPPIPIRLIAIQLVPPLLDPSPINAHNLCLNK